MNKHNYLGGVLLVDPSEMDWAGNVPMPLEEKGLR